MTDFEKNVAEAAKALQDIFDAKNKRIAELEALILTFDKAFSVSTVIQALTKAGEEQAMNKYFNTIIELCARASALNGGAEVSEHIRTLLKDKKV